MSTIIIKNNDQIGRITESGKYLTELLIILRGMSRPWINLLDIERQASMYLDSHHIVGCFKGYQGYPANTCLSVNAGLVHCIPKDYILQDGDILKIDAWVDYKWGISDAAVSVVIGWDDSNPAGAHLIHTTKNSLDQSIPHLNVWSSLMAYAHSVYSIVCQWWCEVIKELCGHGVGVKVHEPPYVCNRPHKSMKNTILKPGMVLALEPITAQHSNQYVNQGARDVVTKGGDLWGQREYTVVIDTNGPRIVAGVEDYM